MAFPFLVWLSGGDGNLHEDKSIGGPKSKVLPKATTSGMVTDSSNFDIVGVRMLNVGLYSSPGATENIETTVSYDSGTDRWKVYMYWLGQTSRSVYFPNDGQVHSAFMQFGTEYVASTPWVEVEIDTATVVGIEDHQTVVTNTAGMDIEENKYLSGGVVANTTPKWIQPSSNNSDLYLAFPIACMQGVTHVDGQGVLTNLPDYYLQVNRDGYRMYRDDDTLKVTLYYPAGASEDVTKTITTTGFYFFAGAKGQVILYIDADKFQNAQNRRNYDVQLMNTDRNFFRAMPPSTFDTQMKMPSQHCIYYFQNMSDSAKQVTVYLMALPQAASHVRMVNRIEWLGDGDTTGLVPEGWLPTQTGYTETMSTIGRGYDFYSLVPVGGCQGVVFGLSPSSPVPSDIETSFDLAFGAV